MFIFSIKDDIMRGEKRSILRLTIFMLMLMITVTMAGCRNIPEDGINSDLTEHISVELFESIEAEKDSELILSWVNDNREDLQFNFAIWNIEEKNGRIVSDGEKYIIKDNEMLIFHMESGDIYDLSIGGSVYKTKELLGENTYSIELEAFSGTKKMYFRKDDIETAIILQSREFWEGSEQDQGIIEIVNEVIEYHDNYETAVTYYAEIKNIADFPIKISNCYLEVFDAAGVEVKYTGNVTFIASNSLAPGESTYLSLSGEFYYTYDRYDKDLEMNSWIGTSIIDNTAVDELGGYTLYYKVDEISEEECPTFEVKKLNVKMSEWEEDTLFNSIHKFNGVIKNVGNSNLRNLYLVAIVKNEDGNILGMWSNSWVDSTLRIDKLGMEEEAEFEILVDGHSMSNTGDGADHPWLILIKDSENISVEIKMDFFAID